MPFHSAVFMLAHTRAEGFACGIKGSAIRNPNDHSVAELNEHAQSELKWRIGLHDVCIFACPCEYVYLNILPRLLRISVLQ